MATEDVGKPVIDRRHGNDNPIGPLTVIGIVILVCIVVAHFLR